MNEERGTTVLEGGHIALFLLNIWYLVFPWPLRGARGPAFRQRERPASRDRVRLRPGLLGAEELGLVVGENPSQKDELLAQPQ